MLVNYKFIVSVECNTQNNIDLEISVCWITNNLEVVTVCDLN